MNLVFDIGGTHTRLALTDGQRLERITHLDTDTSATGFASLLGNIEQFLGGKTVRAAVGGIPGQLDPTTGLLVHAPNLSAWTGIPVLERLRSQLRCPVYLENDTALVGLGEATYGAGRGSGIVAYITVSTGVNGIRIVDGKIDRSARGFEIGAMLLPGPLGPISFEELTGGAAMTRHEGKPPSEIKAARVWHQESRNLALGLYDTLVHWSPDVVVLGGPMMRDIAIDEVTAELKKLPPVYASWPELRRGELDGDGGLFGAMTYVRQLSL